RDLETICLKCLEKEPGKRYASAEALADDLRRFLDGRPITARPAGRLERAWRWARRSPRDAVIAALVAVLVLLGGAGAWWLERQATEHRAELKQQAIREETERIFREQENRRQVLAALERAAVLRRQYLWETAKDTLTAAADLLGATGPDDLRRQV